MEEWTKISVKVSILENDGTGSASENSVRVEHPNRDGVDINVGEMLAQQMVYSVRGMSGIMVRPDVWDKLVFLKAFMQSCEQDNMPIGKEMLLLYELVQHGLDEYMATTNGGKCDPVPVVTNLTPMDDQVPNDPA